MSPFSSNWVKNNKERDKELKKRWRLKKPVICKFCAKKIPNEKRGNGIQFCSEECRNNQRANTTNTYRKRMQRAFEDYKAKKGCEICRYNRNGACLDFHHINPRDKQRRITASLFYFRSELFEKELKKCRLVCKNCHYEIHNPKDRNNKI